MNRVELLKMCVSQKNNCFLFYFKIASRLLVGSIWRSFSLCILYTCIYIDIYITFPSVWQGKIAMPGEMGKAVQLEFCALFMNSGTNPSGV